MKKSQRSANLFLFKRYLFPRRGNLLALALWLSVAGVTIGTAQLVVVLAVMSGFQKVLQTNFTRISGEIVVIPRGHPEPSAEFRETVKAANGVEAATPFSLGAGMVTIGRRVAGVVLEGIDPETTGKVTPWKDIWQGRRSDLEKNNPYWIWLGSQVAKKMKVKVGDTVQLMIGDEAGRKIVPFTVTALTHFGIYDHDLHWARMDLSLLEQLFRRAPEEPMYKLRVKEGMPIDGVAEQLREKLGGRGNVKMWSDINQNIFLAVEHQKKLLFLVLEIIVALAAVNVVNLLLMSGYHRRKDIAILRAMGMRVPTIVRFFLVQGLMVGIFGAIIGVVLGVELSVLIEKFQPQLLSEAIYNVTKLPMKIDLTDVLWVAIGGVVTCVVFSLLPALRAARAIPGEALRYE